MGISNKSHGKKTNKETQSPMLKIFKDIMQKDTVEPEKVTLLKDRKKDKKRKFYSESRSKSDNRSFDSSSTDRYRSQKLGNIIVQNITENKEECEETSDGVYREDKKESWWCMNDSSNKKGKKKRKKSGDTCSRVSCALKNILGGECSCVALLVLLFTVSVVIAFMVIFKSEMPCDDIRIQKKRQLPEGYGTEMDAQLNSLNDDVGSEKNNNYKRSYAELSDDLASILDNQKMDTQTSDALRDFFQKLVQTDAQIKKLKHDISNYYQKDNLKTFNERIKRSLRNRLKHRFRERNKINRSINKRNTILGNDFINNSSAIKGYIIEEEKVLVQYEPGRKRNFPKCSHSHESKSHEKKLKHPFYKHSQRIDEMLKYKRPETVTNTLIREQSTQTKKFPTKEIKFIDYKVYDQNDDAVTHKAKTKTDKQTAKDTEFDIKSFLSTLPVYDAATSAATSINPSDGTSYSEVTNLIDDHVGYRKLMEVDEEDNEELNYEDVKEVLTDEHQELDDLDRKGDRKKRQNDQEPEPDINHYKTYSSKILNPNWKGPMPFYPDEINTMIKHAALQNLNIKLPTYPKHWNPDRQKFKKDVSDTEYIEDYTDNKYDKMAKLAQAYSDYGVVYNRKTEDGKDKINRPENRYKQSMQKRFFKNIIFGGTAKGGKKEGIRFEYKPGTVPDEHDAILHDVTKHIKFVKRPVQEKHGTILHPINTDIQSVFDLPYINRATTPSKNMKANLDLGMKKVLRSLKSIDNTNITELNKSILNNTNPIDDVFGFIALLGDWFRKLSTLSGESNEAPEFTNGSLFNITKAKNVSSETKNTSDILYPVYDLDMVDNIGHRSRVLMSFDGNNNTDNMQHTTYIKTIQHNNTNDSENIVPIALVLATNISNSSKDNETKEKENMTSIVKRSVDDSKLVFWNGLYDDDEYGIKSDYSENLREKAFMRNKNVFQKTKDWIKGKFRNKTRQVRGKMKKKFKPSLETKTAKKTNEKLERKEKDHKPKQRKIRNSNQDTDTMKKTFTILTENMKKVCQEAARAIENTKNIEVRDDNKQGAAATSMMQHLVRLMSELVDIQVQQKTCAKLPSDLQNFLEWLTAPGDSNTRVDELSNNLNNYEVEDGFDRSGKSTESNFLTTISEDNHQDDRTECLGTIKAVQDLIMQYEGMNDEDKSKMSGVKEYLQHQLAFLNKKLNNLDESNFYKLYQKRSRMKRTSSNGKSNRNNKYVKSFGKKHTKTTPDNDVTKNDEDNDNFNKRNKVQK